MDFGQLLSKGGGRLKSSKIRELMALAADPEIISMAGGMPDAANFPYREIREIEDGWSDGERAAAYQYGPTGGYPPLIEQIAAYEASSGIDTSEQQIPSHLRSAAGNPAGHPYPLRSGRHDTGRGADIYRRGGLALSATEWIRPEWRWTTRGLSPKPWKRG